MIIDWEKHYEVLKTSVPTADIRLRSYERIKMEGGLVKDFHSYTGIDTFKLKKFSFDHNKGINSTGLRVLEKYGDLDYRSIGTIKNYLVNTQDRDFARESLFTTKEIDSIQGLSVSNSSSGRRWKLDHAPAVGDPTHMVEFGTGRRAFAREV